MTTETGQLRAVPSEGDEDMDLVIRRTLADGSEETIEIRHASKDFIVELLDRMADQTLFGVDMDPIQALRYELAIERLARAYAAHGVKLETTVPRKRSTDPSLEAWLALATGDPGETLSVENAHTARMNRSGVPKTHRFKKADQTLGDLNYSTKVDCDVCGHEGFAWARKPGHTVKCKECKTPLVVEHRYREVGRADADGCTLRARRPAGHLEGHEMI